MAPTDAISVGALPLTVARLDTPIMDLQPPKIVLDALADLDVRSDAYRTTEVDRLLASTVVDCEALPDEERNGLWAERAAFAFSTREAPGGGPWGTHFQPRMSGHNEDGTAFLVPDIADAEEGTIAYWAKRSKEVNHPVLVARYADLVWDFDGAGGVASIGREKFECAGRAIDAYVAASVIDTGDAWGETRFSLPRALQISTSIKDEKRTADVVEAAIAYVDRTAKKDKIGTYCYLFDMLLPSKKGPPLTADQERGVVAMFERRFEEMTMPGAGWDVDPYGPRDVGLRLAGYYERKGMTIEREQTYQAIGEAFERRSKIGDSLTGMMFLQEAQEFFVAAGRRDEADRVQLEAQRLGPEVQKQLPVTTVSHEIPSEKVDAYLDAMVAGGVQVALARFVLRFIPNQIEIAERAEKASKQFVSQAIFGANTTKLGHGHIEANVGDERGDPDGRSVHATADNLQYLTAWISWVLERLIQDGMTPAQVAEFMEPCPLIAEDRVPLILQGIEAYFLGDYVQAIHFLIPQIERALVCLPPLVGRPSNKDHRTGRGVMQFKNLNDLLSAGEWPVPGEEGEDIRMYILSVLAHPKGLNIRNDVCHGLWSVGHFTRAACERVLHVLLTVSLIRSEPKANADEEHVAEEGDDSEPKENPATATGDDGH